MNKYFSYPYPTIIILIITAIFLTLPQKNGWCMDSSMDPMEEKEKKGDSEKRSDNPSNIHEKYIPSPPIQKIAAGYSGPQWGLREEEIEFLFQKSKGFVCIIEFGGHFKRLNQTWKDVLGWEIQELLDTPYINFVHPDDIENTLEYEKNFKPTGLINRFRCKDGSYRWLDWIGLTSLREEHMQRRLGNPLSIARDVTLQKNMEKKLEDKLRGVPEDSWHLKNQVLEALVDTQTSYLLNIYESQKSDKPRYPFLQLVIDHLIRLGKSEYGFIGEVSSDPSDKIIALYTWGYTFNPKETPEKLEDVSNKLSQDIFSTKKTLMISNMNDYLKEIESFSDLPQLKSFLGVPLIIHDKVVGIVGLFNFLAVDNYKENILALLDPLFLLSGGMINGIKMEQAHKEIELQHVETQQHLEDVSIAKSSFLAHMSHEIRTPLTGLLGMLDLINKESLPKEDLAYLQTARGSGLALLSILNDILDISKIEAGQLTIEHIKFNPIMIAQEVVQLFTLEAVKKDVEIKLTTSSHIPSYLMGDPTRFRQILSNLVSNAVKFTTSGSIFVSLNGICNKGTNKLTLVGDITDTGIGIPFDIQQHLFKPFIQVDSSVTRRFGGTGLGLYITRMLCEMMGGKINVSSEVGKGSTFHFKICLGLPDAQPVFSESKSPSQVPGKLENFRILVAEDNLTNQLVLKTMLTRAGCSVTTVENGQEALKAVTIDRYDLVLMDGEMPVMDGLMATQKIREIFDMRTLPIIGVTAYAMKEDRERFLGVGMNGYLTKPIQKEGLYTEILRCLKKE